MKIEEYLQMLQDDLKSSARRLHLLHSWLSQHVNDPLQIKRAGGIAKSGWNYEILRKVMEFSSPH